MDLNALFKISYGLYVISSIRDGKYNGFLGNAVSQVNSDPPTFAVIVNKKNLTHDFIDTSNILSMSILSEKTPMTFIGRFGFKTGRDIDKFENIKFKTGIQDVPVVLEYTTAYIICDVFKKIDMGSHTIFIGNLLDAETVSSEPVMTYAYYHDVLRGKTSVNAPTFVKPSQN